MSDSERKAVETVMNRYFEGMKNADVELLESAFHKDAGFFGYVGEELFAGPVGGLFEWVSANLTPGACGPSFRLELDAVETHGPIATVSCRELGFLGHDFLQYFTLLNEGRGWKITCKSFAAL
jgi:hypothetical protein